MSCNETLFLVINCVRSCKEITTDKVCKSDSCLQEKEASMLSEKNQSDRNDPVWLKDFSAATQCSVVVLFLEYKEAKQ